MKELEKTTMGIIELLSDIGFRDMTEYVNAITVSISIVSLKTRVDHTEIISKIEDLLNNLEMLEEHRLIDKPFINEDGRVEFIKSRFHIEGN